MFFQRHKVQKVRDLVYSAHKIFVLTGAGISAASGVPTFRGSTKSLWKNLEFMKYAHAETLREDPQGVWQAHEYMRSLIDGCKPNAGHLALQKLAGEHEVALFTQNVDGLHQSGTFYAHEMHGSIHDLACASADCEYKEMAPRNRLLEQREVCPKCGSYMRHDTVLFGEPVRFFDEMIAALAGANLVIFIGTSGLVTDTRAICNYAKSKAVPVVEVNTAVFTRVTLCADIVVRDRAEHFLADLVA
ncbi:MAG: SIR2 family NAD-dependent protein deacylase [Patescibacteria group bacterium]